MRVVAFINQASVIDRGPPPESRIGPLGAVEVEPDAQDPGGVPLRLEALVMKALLLQSPHQALDRPVLSRVK
jgi:hypothetical protein